MHFTRMDCITPLTREQSEPASSALTLAFHVLVLERALALITQSLSGTEQELAFKASPDAFTACEVPIALEEALSALHAIKLSLRHPHPQSQIRRAPLA
jgi:hypothetical protein